MRKFLPLLILVFACSDPVRPEDPPRRAYRAVQAQNSNLQWGKAQWSQGFVFRGFRSGGEAMHTRTEPSEQTAFKVLYDDHNIYFQIRCNDTGSITRISETGNWWDADWVEVNIDGQLSGTTAVSYNTSAGGLFRADWITGNGADWEGISSQATGTVTIDSDGWIVEMKIPTSELRTVRYKGQIMGLQVHRYLARDRELSNWQPLHGDFLSEWVSQSGRLLLF